MATKCDVLIGEFGGMVLKNDFRANQDLKKLGDTWRRGFSADFRETKVAFRRGMMLLTRIWVGHILLTINIDHVLPNHGGTFS